MKAFLVLVSIGVAMAPISTAPANEDLAKIRDHERGRITHDVERTANGEIVIRDRETGRITVEIERTPSDRIQFRDHRTGELLDDAETGVDHPLY